MCNLDKDIYEECHSIEINIDKSQEYVKQLSYYDSIVSDCLHSLEHGALNAIEITEVAIITRDALRKRRKVKDKLATIKVAKSCYSVKNIKRFMNGSKKRKYRPRVMKGLKYE